MPLVDIQEEPTFQTRRIYDPAGSKGAALQGVDANTSVISRVPRILLFESMAGGTDAQVQGKVHVDSEWAILATITGATAAVQVHTFDPRYNFVRTVRSAGSANYLVFAQE